MNKICPICHNLCTTRAHVPGCSYCMKMVDKCYKFYKNTEATLDSTWVKTAAEAHKLHESLNTVLNARKDALHYFKLLGRKPDSGHIIRIKLIENASLAAMKIYKELTKTEKSNLAPTMEFRIDLILNDPIEFDIWYNTYTNCSQTQASALLIYENAL
jgi:hypothetical protein